MDKTDKELEVICKILHIDAEDRYNLHKNAIAISEENAGGIKSLLKKHYKNKVNLDFFGSFSVYQVEDKIILTSPHVVNVCGLYGGPEHVGTIVSVYENKEDLKDFLKTRFSYENEYEKVSQKIDNLEYPKTSPNLSLSDKIVSIREKLFTSDNNTKNKNGL